MPENVVKSGEAIQKNSPEFFRKWSMAEENAIEYLADCPTGKSKVRLCFFLIFTEILPLSGREHWLWEKQNKTKPPQCVCFVNDQSTSFFGCILYFRHLSDLALNKVLYEPQHGKQAE